MSSQVPHEHIVFSFIWPSNMLISTSSCIRVDSADFSHMNGNLGFAHNFGQQELFLTVKMKFRVIITCK